MKFIKIIITIILFLNLSNSFAQETCEINENIRKEILQKITDGQKDILKNLNDCYSLDQKLILQASLIDYSQFNNAASQLKEEESFVFRLIKVSPTSLQFASPSLLGKENFMKYATYLYRDALQYANPKLLDNKTFMKEMINIDSRNYIFASEKIKSDESIAAIAFRDNGLLLSSAPEKIKSNKNLVKIAADSNGLAILNADKNLQNNPLFKHLNKAPLEQNSDDIKKFILENYTKKEEKQDLGTVIFNKGKFSQANKIIDRNYVSKWQRKFYYSKDSKDEELKLIAADKNNYSISWKEDFKAHLELITKIQSFFIRHNIDQNTIDNLSTTFLWKVKDQPLTYVFNLYLLRESKDILLGPEFSNITSLTAIVQKQKNDWKMTVVEVIFDSEIKVDVAFENGHRKYVFWDLYNINKNPEIIFKVEDRFKNYFEIFAAQSGGKYNFVSRIDIE